MFEDLTYDVDFFVLYGRAHDYVKARYWKLNYAEAETGYVIQVLLKLRDTTGEILTAKRDSYAIAQSGSNRLSDTFVFRFPISGNVPAVPELRSS